MPPPIAFDLAAGFDVRLATPADQRAVRMLLGEFPAESDRLAAVDRASQLVVGAAAVAHAWRTQPVRGLGLALHVIPPVRRRGVGRALTAAAEQAAAARGAAALYAAQRVDVSTEDFAVWQRLGFRACETVEEHELPLDRFVPRLAPLVDALRRSGRIPATARIVPLYAVRPADVLQLHLDHLGGDRGSLYQKIRGQGPGAFHPRYSRVLLLDDRPVGCILAHRKSERVAAVDANVVVPELRGGWANVWLKLEATQGAAALGITHFHFTSFDHYADTRRFTDMLGGLTTRTHALMIREIERG